MKWFRELSTAKKIIIAICSLLLLVLIAVYLLSQKTKPERIIYGMSFNTPYANELGLDWQAVYDSFLHELNVRHLRLAAHWTMVEKRQDLYNFAELDYQISEAETVGAEVVLAVGRRLPR